ncbi:winged helix-turn-helix domain-containing protein [Hyphococcus sp.]|jgi:DNA-binding response OmpR family regulator|uniref:winged helix-turn-helix domain-containing protein n=1 Tax=Hyphococcus sp. TaxID=2038636 RepID=UPI003D0F96BF
MTSADGSKIWRFGAVEYDERAARIRRDGASFALDRSSAAILSALLAAQGEAITKDSLLEIGWPGRVVHENSLAKAVGRLRKALGPEGPNLKAIYGAGYCLAVTADEGGAAAPAGPRNRIFAMALGAAAIGLVGVLLILALLMSGRGLSSAEETALISSEPGDTVGRILWVDDHPENNTTEKADFEAQGIAVYNVRTSEEALTMLSMYPHYDAVISDMGRNGEPLAGFKLLEEMRARGDATPFYLYTILTSEAQHALLAEKGGQGAAEAREDLYGFILPLMAQKAEQE